MEQVAKNNSIDAFWNPTYIDVERFQTELLKYVSNSFVFGTVNITRGEEDYITIKPKDNVTIFIDSASHVHMVSPFPIPTDALLEIAEKAGLLDRIRALAYLGSDEITLPYDDAMRCYLLLEKFNQEHGGNDVETFGDNGISFERLYDRISGQVYHINDIDKKNHSRGNVAEVIQRRDGWSTMQDFIKWEEDLAKQQTAHQVSDSTVADEKSKASKDTTKSTVTKAMLTLTIAGSEALNSRRLMHLIEMLPDDVKCTSIMQHLIKECDEVIIDIQFTITGKLDTNEILKTVHLGYYDNIKRTTIQLMY